MTINELVLDSIGTDKINVKDYTLKLLENSGVYEEGKYLGYKLDILEEENNIVLRINELDSEVTMNEDMIMLLELNTLNLFDLLLSKRNEDNGVLFNIKNRLKLVLEKRYKDYKRMEIKTCSVKKSLVSITISNECNNDKVTIVITGVANKGLSALDERLFLEK